MYADRLGNITPFRVMELMERAKTLESAGHRVVHFEVGEPDFATAEPIVAAGIRALPESEIQTSLPGSEHPSIAPVFGQ